MKRIVAGMAAIAVLAAAAAAQRSSEAIAGWTLGDPAMPTDNGSPTVIQMSKAAAGVTITYVAFAAGEGGSVSVDFAAVRKCRDQWFGARLSFDDPAVPRETAVRGEIHEAFAKFRAKCGPPPVAETILMAGFGEAFAAAQKQAAVPEDQQPGGNVEMQSSDRG